jgi:hypothetical protein
MFRIEHLETFEYRRGWTPRYVPPASSTNVTVPGPRHKATRCRAFEDQSTGPELRGINFNVSQGVEGKRGLEGEVC